MGAVVMIASCTTPKPDYTILEGNITHKSSETVKVVGADFEKDIAIHETGQFRDTLYLKHDGFYELYFGPEVAGVYLEKGNSLNISFDETQIGKTLSFSGDSGEFNNFLLKKSKWNESRLTYPVLFSMNEQEFLQALDADRASLDSLYSANKLSKKHKDILQKEDRYFDATLIENYENAHGYYAQNPEYKTQAGFYDSLKDINFADTTEFRKNSTYRDLLETHWMRVTNSQVSMDDPAFSTQFLKNIDKEFPNGYAKDKLMFGHLKYWLSPNEAMDEMVAIYRNSNPGKENLNEINDRYDVLKKVTPGNDSPTFNYENFKGGTTNLEDLRGKYVYIDVWATWCGPCLQEIPHLKEFEEDYKDKNVQVVSISIDEPKNYEKWRAMVADKELGGLQLMADNAWKSDFVQKYGIMGIPRFILLDPEGKIVSPDAHRPSNPKLREQVDLLLQNHSL